MLSAASSSASAFGERDDAGLGDVVRKVAGVPRPAAPRNPVAEVDDAAAALRPHVRGRGVRAEERGAQIHVHDRVPVVDGQVGEWPLHVDGRHVDEDVEAAERADHGLHQRRRAVRLREIGVKCRRAPFRRAHGVDRPIGFRLRARVAERHVHASLRQLACDDEADALTAGYQRDFVGEIHVGQMQPAKTRRHGRGKIFFVPCPCLPCLR